MRIDDARIRGAMDSRLSALDASAERRERIRHRIDREEETVVRKKITISIALAVIALLTLAGVALAASLNLFAFFGERDARLAEIAPKATLATESPATVESGELGTTVAAIRNAYYDGQTLLVAYSIENGTRTERFDPSEEQLSQMTKLDAPPFIASQDGEGQAILDEFNAAIESGTPCGIVRYSVYPSDHTETDDGIDLPPTQEMQESAPDGGQYMLREYESPLPEGARNRESLSIRIRLWRSASWTYFDGKDCYARSDRREAGAMTAAVARADSETRRFAGEGTYNGVKVQVEADASAVHADITVTAEADAFTPLDEDSWYVLDVRDAQGNALRTSEFRAVDPRTVAAAFEGTGILPDRLTVRILIQSEGEWDEDAAFAAATPIVLTTAE
jgi:hypothetical protein